ncbi:MAG TPA: serine/threonine-protein kinase [Thermoanaerobaculia bacterium]|nr:serine/threonine-protein kinase [Thermoanaerobaculia bacterium]
MELIGRRFGHIRVSEVVGKGGMGDVYAGYDEKLERKVAVKVLNADQRLDEEARERLLREARALSQLDHPNICRIHDYIETGDVDLLVLEYIDGRTLHEALLEKKTRGELLRIAAAVAEVLVKAHRAGIVHRDLKPENVMLTSSGEVKVLDFGLARWLHRRSTTGEQTPAPRLPVRASFDAAGDAHDSGGHETLLLPPFSDAYAPRADSGRGQRAVATAVGITLGTPTYMSPEQARGETLTPASDMFSFGLLLQIMFTGQDPHPIDLTAREVILRVARGETLPVQGAPGDMTALINRLKNFAPADRPTALETLERLRALQEKPQRFARRAIAAVIALVAALGAWRYTVDLKAERAIAVAARAEAERRRAQADDLINFMVGDLRVKLEPLGKLDIMDDVAERALAYTRTARPEHLSPSELVQNGKALHQLTQVRIAQGKLDAAHEHARRSLVLTSAAAKRDARSPDVQLALATSHFWVGNVRRLRGEYPEALSELQRYRDVTVRLAEQYPKNDEYQIERIYGHGAVAAILERQGRFEEALQEHAPTVAVNRARVAADPANTAKQAELAYTLNRIAYVLQNLGRLNEAGQHFESEHEIYAQLVRGDSRQRKWQDRLANSHSYLAALYEMTGRKEAAVEHRQSELELYRQLYEHDQANVMWKRNYALSMMRLADLLRRREQKASAMPLFARSEALLGEIITADPTHPGWRRDLAVVKIAHARALLATKSADEAASLARAAEKSLAELSLDDRWNRRSLADSQLTLGLAEAAAGGDAGAAWSRALKTIEALAGDSTDPVILGTYARALLHLHRVDAAQPVLARLHSYGYNADELDQLITAVHRGRAQEERDGSRNGKQ